MGDLTFGGPKNKLKPLKRSRPSFWGVGLGGLRQGFSAWPLAVLELAL